LYEKRFVCVRKRVIEISRLLQVLLSCSRVDGQSDIRGVEESRPKGYPLFRKTNSDPGIEPMSQSSHFDILRVRLSQYIYLVC
jgi:hypothetical protein